MQQQDYDYARYEKIIRKLLDSMLRDPDNLEIGENISDIPQVKIIFDGYGYDEETDTEGGDTSSESYAVFIHRDAGSSLDWSFPEHDMTPWALIHRPKEEICIHVWYDVVRDVWDIRALEEVDNDEHSYTSIMAVLEQLYEWYFADYDQESESSDSVADTPHSPLDWPFAKK
jgi:hypothetical protein